MFTCFFFFLNITFKYYVLKFLFEAGSIDKIANASKIVIKNKITMTVSEKIYQFTKKIYIYLQ